jgi:hypothetical protein
MKGTYYVSAFPSIAGYFGKPFQGSGIKAGHQFSFGYFISKQLSVNIETRQILQIEKENMGYFPKKISKKFTVYPSFNMRYLLLNKKISPFVETGLNNIIVLINNNFFYDRLFEYTLSVNLGLGIQIPLSDFYFCFTASFLKPVLKYVSFSDKYIEGSYGFCFKPTIGYYFKY